MFEPRSSSLQCLSGSCGAGVGQQMCNEMPRDGRGSIPGWYGVKTKLHVIRKEMGEPSLNIPAVDETENTTNQPTFSGCD